MSPLIITTITRSTPASRKTKPAASSSGHTPANCKVIRLEAPSKFGSAYSFVPAFMLSNVMSLSPKIDEVRECPFAMQIWTSFESRNHIDNNFVLVSGYNIIRRDRVTGDHGGMYVCDSIRYDVLSDFMDENFEVIVG